MDGSKDKTTELVNDITLPINKVDFFADLFGMLKDGYEAQGEQAKIADGHARAILKALTPRLTLGAIDELLGSSILKRA